MSWDRKDEGVSRGQNAEMIFTFRRVYGREGGLDWSGGNYLGLARRRGEVDGGETAGGKGLTGANGEPLNYSAQPNDAEMASLGLMG